MLPTLGQYGLGKFFNDAEAALLGLDQVHDALLLVVLPLTGGEQLPPHCPLLAGQLFALHQVHQGHQGP